MLIVEIVVVLALILINAYFSMSEMAIVSAKKNRLESRADKGDKKAQVALELSRNPNKFLSTVQIGITLIGILSGAFGGATIAEKLAFELAKVPWLSPYAGGVAVGIVVIVITYLSLVIGELVPKRIALNSAETVAISVASVMQLVSKIFAPFVGLMSKSSSLILKLLGVKLSSEPSVTEEDLRNLLFQGKEMGIIEESEQNMVERIFRLSDRDVSAVMTPWHEMVFLDVDAVQEEIMEKISLQPYSRFPVIKESMDNVLGVVNSRDLLIQYIKEGSINLREVMQQPFFLPESTPALDSVELLRTSAVDIAFVIDEYGSVIGLVGKGDILESIIGTVATKEDMIDDSVVLRDDGSWLFDGMVQIDDLKTYLDIETLPDEESGKYETVSGLMMAGLSRIPIVGDHFEWSDYRFEIVDMDGLRVDKVMVIPLMNLEN